MPRPTRAVLYLRVSDPRQVENLSLDTQEKACLEHCEHHGWEVVGIFREEGESAKTADRTELKKLLAWCGRRRRRADGMLVYRFSRAARNAADYHMLKALLASREIDLVSVTETRGDSPAEHLLENVIAAVNQFDNEVRSEQARNGMRAAAAQGKWVWRLPLGYRRVGNAIQLDPKTAPIVQGAFELAAQGSSYPELTRYLRDAGLRTRTGRPIAQGQLNTLLRSPFYKARLVNLGWKIDVQGQWPALVSPELWNRAQVARLKRGRPELECKRRKTRPDFPLRRFVSCAHCGSPSTGSWSRGRSRYYGYYHCFSCKNLRVKKQVLEDAFVDLLRDLQPTKKVVRLWREVVEDVWNQRNEEKTLHCSEAQEKVALLTARRERLLDLALDDGIDRQLFQRKMKDLDIELAKAELMASTPVEAQEDLAPALDQAEHVLLHCASIWEAGEPPVRARFQDLAFPQGIPYHRDTGFGTALTMRIFSDLREIERGNTKMVPPTGFEPVSPA